MANRILIGASRIYCDGVDEQYYRNNVLYDQMRALASLARQYGMKARENISRALVAGQTDDIAMYAYFAGVEARRAITIARRVEMLDEVRRDYGINPVIDWEAL